MCGRSGKFGSAVRWKQLLPCNGRTAITRQTSITWQLDTTEIGKVFRSYEYRKSDSDKIRRKINNFEGIMLSHGKIVVSETNKCLFEICTFQNQ